MVLLVALMIMIPQCRGAVVHNMLGLGLDDWEAFADVDGVKLAPEGSEFSSCSGRDEEYDSFYNTYSSAELRCQIETEYLWPDIFAFYRSGLESRGWRAVAASNSRLDNPHDQDRSGVSCMWYQDGYYLEYRFPEDRSASIQWAGIRSPAPASPERITYSMAIWKSDLQPAGGAPDFLCAGL